MPRLILAHMFLRRVLNFFNLFWYVLICRIVEIGWVFRGKKTYFILSMCISLFRNIFPGKERGPSFEETWIPFTQGCFVPRFVEIDPLNMKMWKVYRRTTDNQKSSLEFFSSDELIQTDTSNQLQRNYKGCKTK